MPLVPYDKSFFDFEKFFEDENKWLIPRISPSVPAMDIYETEKDIVTELNAPGFDPEKINITIENGILKVSGNIEEKKEEKNKKGYWRKEIRRGSFERMVRLPASVKEDEIDATYEKGILKIIMPKKEQKKIESKKIKVKEIKK